MWLRLDVISRTTRLAECQGQSQALKSSRTKQINVLRKQATRLSE